MGLTIQRGGGGGSGASTADTFVTISHDADLTGERVLTAGAGIGITDGGANSTVTVALSGIGARVYNNANIAVNNNTTTAFTFNTESYDTDTIHDTGSNTGRLTCKTAGKYIIVGNIAWDLNAVAALADLYIRLNGTTYIAINRITVPSTTNDELYQQVVGMYSLAVNDYVELLGFQISGVNKNGQTSGVWGISFMMHLIG